MPAARITAVHQGFVEDLELDLVRESARHLRELFGAVFELLTLLDSTFGRWRVDDAGDIAFADDAALAKDTLMARIYAAADGSAKVKGRLTASQPLPRARRTKAPA